MVVVGVQVDIGWVGSQECEGSVMAGKQLERDGSPVRVGRQLRVKRLAPYHRRMGSSKGSEREEFSA